MTGKRKQSVRPYAETNSQKKLKTGKKRASKAKSCSKDYVEVWQKGSQGDGGPGP